MNSPEQCVISLAGRPIDDVPSASDRGCNDVLAAVLTPSGLAPFFVLGVLAQRPSTLGEIVAAAHRIGEQHWRPTTDVVAVCVRRMLGDGLVGRGFGECAPQAVRLHLLGPGRESLRVLLDTPVEPPFTSLSVLFATFKLYFLDVAESEEDKTRLLADAQRACQTELGRLRHSRRGCVALEMPFVERSLDRAIRREEAQLAWLASLDTRTQRTGRARAGVHRNRASEEFSS